ncbi:aminoglycoside phosphotransferase family protein [Microbacterium lushaniae]|uniref:Aminoglycoside phosphotransferase family protein n=1 Tax=Microbacterium lushaniae TaxID=2614639 RepID=A0A5J6L4Z7_9MICO|nr:phosphotransferase [Microbacterium lushaniae]QEW03490.1 aminoglycoside phosphotransferase family protein [Microbacterium lushaniae]
MDGQVLNGGNSTTVVRVGGTVHRVTGSWTPAVHELLRALREAGVYEVPEPLGFDDLGREVLSFLPGDVGNYPLPDWLWAPAILDDTGKLLRRIHDASVPLVGRDLPWSLPRHEPEEVICHNDVAPYNMTFSGGRVTGLFDFDTASPGPRIWDLAYLVYRLAPLGEDAGIDITLDERLARLDRLVGAYGLPFRRGEVLDTVAARLLDLATYTDGRLRQTGNLEFGDHAAMYRRDAAYAETLSLLM